MNTLLKHNTFRLLILIIFVMCGCASVDVTKTAKGFFDQTNPNEVQILKIVPDKKHVELGTVAVSGFNASDTAKMHNAVRTKSAVLGADAVILTNEGLAPGGWGGMKLWSTGVAIKFK